MKTTNSHAIKDVLKLYQSESLTTRAFVYARERLAPIVTIANHVPSKGCLLDIGCGHGLFAALIALTSKNRKIVAIDPSAAKIQVAKRMSQSLLIDFRLGNIEIIKEKFSIITILDVLYLLSYEQKIQLLQQCRQLISNDGMVLLKTNDTRPYWKYAITYCQEKLMTTCGLTMGQGKLHFLSAEEHLCLLKQVGFDAELIHLSHWSPYPHCLFIARPIA